MAAAVEPLRADPHRGKCLSGLLSGYRSIRAARERYRIVYRIEAEEVVIVAIGSRLPGDPKDVYAQLARLLAEGS